MTRAMLLPALLLAAGDRPAASRLGRPDRVLIPAGAFIKGSNQGADDERPRGKTQLPAYKIDRTEVTRAMYARCGRLAPVIVSHSLWSTVIFAVFPMR